MNCETCNELFGADDVKDEEFAPNDTKADSLQIVFQCPHCGQGYYTFIALDTFTLDDAIPGKAVES